ncbi:MAG: hypothetical protein ACM3OO_04055 [Planctomycetaceae bacterium]
MAEHHPEVTSRSEQCVRALEEAEAGIREILEWDCMTRASLTALETALRRLEVAMAEARIGLFIQEQECGL